MRGSAFMAENIIQSEIDSNNAVIQRAKAASESPGQIMLTSPGNNSSLSPQIIWTPRFIVTFVLVLVIGLSIASLLTQGWLNGYYRAEWVLLAYTALAAGCWIAMIARTRSNWLRIAGVFGCFWSILTCINYILSWFAVDPSLPIIAHLNAATNSALFGAYICLSVARTPLRRWDTWFFRLTPIIGVVFVMLIYLLTPTEFRSLGRLESTIAAVALYFSIAVWWLRSSCWRTQPGPTFLFSMVPTILLILAIPNIANAGTNFFLTQVIFLCLLLGALRILQGENVKV